MAAACCAIVSLSLGADPAPALAVVAGGGVSLMFDGYAAAYPNDDAGTDDFELHVYAPQALELLAENAGRGAIAAAGCATHVAAALAAAGGWMRAPLCLKQAFIPLWRVIGPA